MYKDSEVRNYEIKELYYIIYRKAIREGKKPFEAKDEAFSAIELRYCIARGTAENIMYHSIRVDNKMFANMFRERNEQLLELLKEVKDETG